MQAFVTLDAEGRAQFGSSPCWNEILSTQLPADGVAEEASLSLMVSNALTWGSCLELLGNSCTHRWFPEILVWNYAHAQAVFLAECGSGVLNL